MNHLLGALGAVPPTTNSYFMHSDSKSYTHQDDASTMNYGYDNVSHLLEQLCPLSKSQHVVHNVVMIQQRSFRLASCSLVYKFISKIN